MAIWIGCNYYWWAIKCAAGWKRRNLIASRKKRSKVSNFLHPPRNLVTLLLQLHNKNLQKTITPHHHLWVLRSRLYCKHTVPSYLSRSTGSAGLTGQGGQEVRQRSLCGATGLGTLMATQQTKTPQGYGKIYKTDGSIYLGSWSRGKAEGKGLFIQNDGSFYEG